jgi:hypothetical protein
VEASGFTSPDETSFHVPEEWYNQSATTRAFERAVTYDKKSGTAISTEFGKTVFANWTHTAPGNTTVVRLTYKLPFTALLASKEPPTLHYTLYRQKQSGVRETTFSHHTTLPDGWSTDWENAPESTTPDSSIDTVVALVASQH